MLKERSLSSSWMLFSVIFAMAFLCFAATGNAWAAENTTPLQGSGSQDDPYVITSPDELRMINDNLNACYKLGSDIDMKGYEFEPIGTQSGPFKGSLDGDGHAIDSFGVVTDDKNVNPIDIGLFAYTANASIKNLNISLE